MRVISVKTMKKIESNNFKNKNSFFFMKKAGQGCAKEILKINKSKNFLIYCGPGNNGGDGFIIGHELINKGYQVRIISTTQISQLLIVYLVLVLIETLKKSIKIFSKE